MADKIKLGVIGANPTRGWGPRGHLPAIVASRDVELTAVCTTRKESAEESASKFGAKLAFHDYREMLASPDIEAVAVLLRVPAHYQVTMDALNAGKHVFTEWPLGKTRAEAVEMRDLAEAKGLRHMVGLQARGNPAIVYARDLVADGYVGEVMACHVSVARGGILNWPSDRSWQKDASLGANALTIAHGHTIDALRFIVGDFKLRVRGGEHPGTAVARDRHATLRGRHFSGQHPGERALGERRGSLGLCGSHTLEGLRIRHGDLWPRRHPGGHVQQHAAARGGPSTGNQGRRFRSPGPSGTARIHKGAGGDPGEGAQERRRNVRQVCRRPSATAPLASRISTPPWTCTAWSTPSRSRPSRDGPWIYRSLSEYSNGGEMASFDFAPLRSGRTVITAFLRSS